jgi:Ca2+:H+ antiporter
MISRLAPRWTEAAPVAALVALAVAWPLHPEGPLLAPLALLLGGAVLAAVHHAEVVAHRVGEPFGSLVLALAVTAIEVALIVTLMFGGGEGTASLARDTVFAAIMITCNGIVGLSVLVAGRHQRAVAFNQEGAAAAFATVCTVASLSLVLPTFTESAPARQFTDAQLAFAAIASLALWGVFVLTQTVRHRDFFLPVDDDGAPQGDPDQDADHHAAPPTDRQTLVSAGLLLVSLVSVVGLAKLESAAIESGVEALGLPLTVVGVVIALLVLLPESIAAARNAYRGRLQISLNLAYGSAIASIGLTIPAIAVASRSFDEPLELGLGSTHLVLLFMTVVLGILTIVPGRTTRLQGALHLALLAAYLFLSAVP